MERILQSTAFASRAQLEVERLAAEQELAQARQADVHLTGSIPNEPTTTKLRRRIAETEAEIARAATAAEAEAVSVNHLRELHGQLVAQSRRLTRALVAERLLNDFEFRTCPRCGAGVPDRGDEYSCRLCLQTHPTCRHHLPSPRNKTGSSNK
ncbi:hypothetical protein JGS39_25920 [Streptomyces sp. P01-B04]|uniref:hypothetical protein n=1 Tax=Streptomyces poriferorum TaxID=2798799 RepID=UPI001C5D439D|nr:hypothetical protein [Streptomyces poriferorum]MBW5252389.1 hypothetical protein [Streptomyces poriferorum]MBW5259282.1 hypothetical protein [Streptomyces poriferorum]